jgi:hypothetical protein
MIAVGFVLSFCAKYLLPTIYKKAGEGLGEIAARPTSAAR